MSLLVLLCSGVLVSIAWNYWQRFEVEEAEKRDWYRAFWVWAAKGLGVPVVLWTVLNCGLAPGLPPLLTPIEVIKSAKGPWFALFLRYTWPALLVMASCWTGMTFALMVTALVERMHVGNRGDIRAVILFWSALMLPFSGLVIYLFGWMASGLALLIWLAPITHFGLPWARVRQLPPSYSRAIARMKLGDFNEAEWELIRQLEKCEDDFEGWLLLAELYAVHLHDLAVAEQTIYELCAQPNLNTSQIAVALNRLADWHLALGEDPVSARHALEEIGRRLPGTHVDHMARQRLARMPATREELHVEYEGRRVPLPRRSGEAEKRETAPAPQITRFQAAARADQCVEKLKQDPNHAAAREELATLFACHLDRTELALEQMELLLTLEGPSEQKKAEWLGRMAAWQVHYGRDHEAARALWERLVREYPRSPEAFAAQRRLLLMDMERKLRKVGSPGGKR